MVSSQEIDDDVGDDGDNLDGLGSQRFGEGQILNVFKILQLFRIETLCFTAFFKSHHLKNDVKNKVSISKKLKRLGARFLNFLDF